MMPIINALRIARLRRQHAASTARVDRLRAHFLAAEADLHRAEHIQADAERALRIATLRAL